MPAVAEILCQRCGTKRSTTIPGIARSWLVPLCECGARPQVVRVSRMGRPRPVTDSGSGPAQARGT